MNKVHEAIESWSENQGAPLEIIWHIYLSRECCAKQLCVRLYLCQLAWKEQEQLISGKLSSYFG